MKKTIFTLALAVCFTAGYAQLYNNGGTITVELGATLVVEGSYTATNSGSMVIDGTVQIKGDFINTSGSIPDGSNGWLVFNGTAAQDISGAATTFFCAVEVNNAAGVTLTANDEVMDSTLLLTSGDLTLGAYDLTVASISGANSSSYIVTNGAGELKQTVAASNVTFPVGTASNYNPLILNNTGTSDTYGVIATTTMPANWTTSNHAVGLTWVVSEAVAGASNLAATTEWVVGQQQASFDNTDCAVGVTADDGTTFNWATSGAASGGGPYTRLGSGFTGVGKFVVADYYFEGFDLNLDLFLAGPYNGTNMNTSLTVPTTDPYGLSTTINPIPAGTVDWVRVDILDGTTPDIDFPVQSFAVLLDNNGNLPVKVTGVTKGNYNVAVRHRNHLGACTGSAVTMSGAEPYTFDFTNTGSSLYGTNAMRTIGSIRALWAGDANGDGQVIYQGGSNDPTSISGAVLGDPGNTGSSWTYIVTDGYSDYDINMDGQIIYQGTDNDPTPISTSILGHPGNTGSSWTYIIAAQLP
jgi:hypothetical protein